MASEPEKDFVKLYDALFVARHPEYHRNMAETFHKILHHADCTPDMVRRIRRSVKSHIQCEQHELLRVETPFTDLFLDEYKSWN